MNKPHTPETKRTALATLVRSGDNAAEACRRLAANNITVPERTLRHWAITEPDLLQEIRYQLQPELEKLIIQDSVETELLLLHTTRKAAHQASQQLDDGQAKNPSGVAKDLAIAYGVLTNNNQLRQNKPTQIVQDQGARELIAEIRASLGPIDSTAEDLEYPALLPDVAETNSD